MNIIINLNALETAMAKMNECDPWAICRYCGCELNDSEMARNETVCDQCTFEEEGA